MRIGSCEICKRNWVWVNITILNGKPSQLVCGDCWELAAKDKEPKSFIGIDSGPFHNDPGWDNVIRAAEEDR